MLKVSETTKDAYRVDYSHKELEIRFPIDGITLKNEDIVSESVSLKETLESSQNLTFTGCNASVFEFECFDLITDMEGRYVEAYIKADNTEEIPIFKGYVDKITNKTHEQFTIKMTAYDVMKKINEIDITDWYNSLPFPISIKAMRDSFFAECGKHFSVTQAEDNLVNDLFYVDKTIEKETINGSDIIKPICEINGSFGRINRYGVFEYVHLETGRETIYPAEDLYPKNTLYPEINNDSETVNKPYYETVKFENYRVSAISKVQLANKEGEVIAEAHSSWNNVQGINLEDTLYPSDFIYPAEDIYPSDGGNIFTISNNPLIFGKEGYELKNVAMNLLNKIAGIWYIPMQVNAIGLPYLECGDFVIVSARRSIIYSYIFTRTLKGIQALKDEYESEGDKKQPVYKENLQTSVLKNEQAISDESDRAKDAEEGLGNDINATNIRCQNIEADVGKFKELEAEHFKANQADINYIRANYVTTETFDAQVAHINTLIATEISAVNLRADNIEARAISAENIAATKVDAQQVNSIVASFGFVTASQVTTAVQSALQGQITTGTLRTSHIDYWNGDRYIDLITMLDRRYAPKYS